MSDEHDAEIITRYVEEQAHEKVVHVERASTAMVGPVRHDIWDVHCAKSRWWVVTNPTNLYTQEDFKSRDVVLTFHVGLALPHDVHAGARRAGLAARVSAAVSPVDPGSSCLARQAAALAHASALLLRCRVGTVGGKFSSWGRVDSNEKPEYRSRSPFRVLMRRASGGR